MNFEPWVIVASGIIGMLISLVLMIVFFVRSQLKPGFIFLFTFFFSLIVLGVGIYYSIKKTFNNLVEMGENMGEKLDSLAYQNNSLLRAELPDSQDVSIQAWKIMHCSIDTSEQVQSHFLNYGSLIHRRTPLPYPFALIQHEGNETAEFIRESYDRENDNIVEENLLLGIKELNCNCNFLMISMTNRINVVQDTEKSEEIKYILYTFDTGKQLVFSTESELWKKAKSLGYDGESRLLKLDEYYALYNAPNQ